MVKALQAILALGTLAGIGYGLYVVAIMFWTALPGLGHGIGNGLDSANRALEENPRAVSDFVKKHGG